MRLAEMMTLRQTIGAGLLVTLTERCPLHCAHCSSASTARGRRLDAGALLRFLGTFRPELRPDVMMLTGGEPLTRPGLVVAAAEAAGARGTRTAVLSGASFARGGGRLPDSVRQVARAVDHFSLSLDAHHEREVAREDVFAALRALLRIGVATSLHLVGEGEDDPYLAQVTAQVRERFGTEVPMLVSAVRPVGRAAAWARPLPAPDASVAAGCGMAAWPVVAVDGAVTACCNQDVVDGRARPAHLVLGDLSSTAWPEVVERARRGPVLRMVRTVGPVHIAARGGEQPSCGGGGYCDTCHRLDDLTGARRWAERAGAGAAGELLQEAALRAGRGGGPATLLRRHGAGRYGELVGAVRPEGGSTHGAGKPVRTGGETTPPEDRSVHPGGESTGAGAGPVRPDGPHRGGTGEAGA
ncbi:Radical SAM superfamily protein [Actinacidiphila yanglinensis]|uniref:Radical SAM superfamily protein n=1 Tax=Actinacidiphila yanglinensis TaxID=310779 RepID=A0A1H6B2F1_9ACTN|nr:radical SAM protein [Actinacidiphila yanglinensis]SEG54296.1 Radical SAM superfamily protein [Actinacidiphila yanglinensis]